MGLFFDTGVDVDNFVDIYETTKYSHSEQTNIQETNVISPTISPQYTITHNPILQFNSPSGSISGAPTTQTPAVQGTAVTPSLIPALSTEQSDMADMGDTVGGGSGSILQNILIIAVIAIGAIMLLPMLFKKKRKVSVDPVSRKVSASSK